MDMYREIGDLRRDGEEDVACFDSVGCFIEGIEPEVFLREDMLDGRGEVFFEFFEHFLIFFDEFPVLFDGKIVDLVDDCGVELVKSADGFKRDSPFRFGFPHSGIFLQPIVVFRDLG
tara:strand:- start:52 stop:402 length:351 start_codon:yes stop_codon:yes gene_type:complete